MRILVADELAQEGLDYLKESGVGFDVKLDLAPEALATEVGAYDAMVVRSKCKVPAKALVNPGKLKAIARAGVGVDTIDLNAATEKGILVMNTAAASTLSTAEHALALMYALARKIPAADAHVKAALPKWSKAKYQGTQLAGKTLGVVGLGRIGQTVASRALAMEMTVLGFDPFYTQPTALDGRVKLVKDFDEFLAQLDVITFHVPGGEGTKHLLNKDRLMGGKCKPNLLIVNDARGEVVDEFALAEALNAKKVTGAAIDVFIKEPPQQDHPLFKCENVVLTPHLGAQTDEAQTAVSVDACKAIVAYLKNGEIRGAVNAGGLKLDLPPDEAPFAELARRIGTLLAGLSENAVKSITLRVSGNRAPKLQNTLLRLATVELLKPHMGGVNVINVEHLARSRGIDMVSIHEPLPPAGLVGDIVGIRVDGVDGETHRILGTVYADGLPRVLRIDNYAMDMVPEGQMVIIVNHDQPGVIGTVGTSFGDAKVNIADMVISRDFGKDGKATALMVLKTDSAPTPALIDRIKGRPEIVRMKSVVLATK